MTRDTQLLGLRAGAGREGGIDRDAFEHLEMQVQLGGALLVVHPQRPSHVRQRPQQTAIDGGQAAEGFRVASVLQRQLLAGQRSSRAGRARTGHWPTRRKPGHWPAT